MISPGPLAPMTLPRRKMTHPVPLVAADHINIIVFSLDGAAGHPFNEGYPQDGDEGFAITFSTKPAAFAGGDNQAFHPVSSPRFR